MLIISYQLRKVQAAMAEKKLQRVHFIGIGGVGMSGIARVAHDQGMVVSGSDLKESRYTLQLKQMGIDVHIGHAPENIPEQDPDVVVVSTAILPENPEYKAAQDRGLEIWHRAKMLAALGCGKKTLAVAGTHGKTTTSSMLASTLDAMGEEPSFLIGGIVSAYHTNAHSGKGEYYVVEADESDKSFTYLDPYVVLVTNIEADHLDHYDDLNEIRDKFCEFMSSTAEDGKLVVCGDEKPVIEVANKSGQPYVSYGFSDECDVRIENYKSVGIGSSFTVRFPDGQIIETGIKQNPGRHNVLNAVGVLTVAYVLGLPVELAAQELAEFRGVRRRFDLVNEVNEITIVDDYAHHPTEIKATIDAASKLAFNRVVVCFQPHRYSRVKLFTEVLRDEFSHAFDNADEIVFMDVYSAGETPLPGVNGKTFLDVITEHDQAPVAHYVPKRMELVDELCSILKPGDLLLTMGAGDITTVGPLVVEALRNE